MRLRNKHTGTVVHASGALASRLKDYEEVTDDGVRDDSERRSEARSSVVDSGKQPRKRAAGRRRSADKGTDS